MKILQLIFLSLLLLGCASSDKLKRSTQQMEVDGISDDWPQLVHFDKGLGIAYGVTFDNSHLYVLAKIKEENVRRRIISSGLTVWIDPNGKKKQNIGVKYPIMEGAFDMINRELNGRQIKALDEDKLTNVMLQGVFSDEMQIVQKKSLKIDLDVKIKIDTVQNLIYEMKVPLSLLAQDAKNDLEKIAIGFEVSGPGRHIEGDRPSRGGRTRSGGGRPGGGGSPRGGRGGGTPGGSQNVNSSNSPIVWYLVEI